LNSSRMSYSEEFTVHMTKLKETLADDTDIILTEGCDDSSVFRFEHFPQTFGKTIGNPDESFAAE
jgi:hypothetical protein